MTNSLKSYANFNTLTVTGRIFAIEAVSNNGDEWLAVTLISNLADDDGGVTFTFNTKTMFGLYNADKLPVGREITIVGHLKSVTETWFDKKSGSRKLLKRPNMHLDGVSIPTGGFGRMPADKAQPRQSGGEVVVDDTPQIKTEAKQDAQPKVAAPAFGSPGVSF